MKNVLNKKNIRNVLIVLAMMGVIEFTVVPETNSMFIEDNTSKPLIYQAGLYKLYLDFDSMVGKSIQIDRNNSDINNVTLVIEIPRNSNIMSDNEVKTDTFKVNASSAYTIKDFSTVGATSTFDGTSFKLVTLNNSNQNKIQLKVSAKVTENGVHLDIPIEEIINTGNLTEKYFTYTNVIYNKTLEQYKKELGYLDCIVKSSNEFWVPKEHVQNEEVKTKFNSWIKDEGNTTDTLRKDNYDSSVSKYIKKYFFDVNDNFKMNQIITLDGMSVTTNENYYIYKIEDNFVGYAKTYAESVNGKTNKFYFTNVNSLNTNSKLNEVLTKYLTTYTNNNVNESLSYITSKDTNLLNIVNGSKTVLGLSFSGDTSIRCIQIVDNFEGYVKTYAGVSSGKTNRFYFTDIDKLNTDNKLNGVFEYYLATYAGKNGAEATKIRQYVTDMYNISVKDLINGYTTLSSGKTEKVEAVGFSSIVSGTVKGVEIINLTQIENSVGVEYNEDLPYDFKIVHSNTGAVYTDIRNMTSDFAMKFNGTSPDFESYCQQNKYDTKYCDDLYNNVIAFNSNLNKAIRNNKIVDGVNEKIRVTKVIISDEKFVADVNKRRKFEFTVYSFGTNYNYVTIKEINTDHNPVALEENGIDVVSTESSFALLSLNDTNVSSGNTKIGNNDIEDLGIKEEFLTDVIKLHVTDINNGKNVSVTAKSDDNFVDIIKSLDDKYNAIKSTVIPSSAHVAEEDGLYRFTCTIKTK